MIIANVVAEAVDNLWTTDDIDSLKPIEETGSPTVYESIKIRVEQRRPQYRYPVFL